MILSVILLLMLMILLSTVQASDLWQQLELASELECGLRDWTGTGSGLLILMLEKFS